MLESYEITENQNTISENAEFGKAKIRINNNYIGANITKIKKFLYKDTNDNRFYKDIKNKSLLIVSKINNKRKVVQINGFHEGDYGITIYN